MDRIDFAVSALMYRVGEADKLLDAPTPQVRTEAASLCAPQTVVAGGCSVDASSEEACRCRSANQAVMTAVRAI